MAGPGGARIGQELGAFRALSGVDVAIKRGTVHGLIGPNGSGKSTFVNVVTGVFRASAGKICSARGSAAAGPHAWPSHGITRTFQSIRLFVDLRPLTTSGRIHLPTQKRFVAHLLQTRAAVAEEAAIAARRWRSWSSSGSPSVRKTRRRTCPTGQQRLLEIARALRGGGPQLLMARRRQRVNLQEPITSRASSRDIKAPASLLVIEHKHGALMGFPT